MIFRDQDGPSALLLMRNLQMRAVAANALHDEGWFVLEAGDLPEAAFLVSKVDRPVGLIICDYVVDGQSGPEVVQGLAPDGLPPVVYIYDAWSYVPDRLRGSIPKDQVLDGPLTARSLLDVISRRVGVGKDFATEEFNSYGRSKASAGGN